VLHAKLDVDPLGVLLAISGDIRILLGCEILIKPKKFFKKYNSVRMAAGLAAGTGAFGGTIWLGAATSAEDAATEDIELNTINEQATQDESTPLLGRGRAGKPKKWKGGWSKLLNKQSVRNYYKKRGNSEGGSVPISAPDNTTTTTSEEPTETTPLTPKQNEIRNRVSGRPIRSYQYQYKGRTYHTTIIRCI